MDDPQHHMTAMSQMMAAPLPTGLQPPPQTTQDLKKRRPAKPKNYKDPNKPKRVLPPFMFFSVAMRPKVLAEHPDLSFGDRAKKLSEWWNKLDPKAKKVYEDMTEQDKLRHAREMESYVPNPDIPKARRRKRQRAEGEPKKPLTTYLLFAQDIRPRLKEENPNASVAAIASMIGTKWAALPEDQRQMYKDKYEIEKAKYLEAKEAFRNRMGPHA